MKAKKIVYTFLMAFLSSCHQCTKQCQCRKGGKWYDESAENKCNKYQFRNDSKGAKLPTQPQSIKGNFTMKENKFILNTEEMNVYFDGKTQSAYMTSVNEVSITNPTEKELVKPIRWLYCRLIKTNRWLNLPKKSVKNSSCNRVDAKDQNSTLKNTCKREQKQ